jgi:HEAT repeat protein
VEAPVELVDLAPTLLGMLDRPVPPAMRGDDLRPLALGRIEHVGPAFSGVTYKRMAVRWPYKLVADLRFNLFQLYDLSADPRELTNLASRRPELLEELKGEIYAWIDTLSAPADRGEPVDPRMLAIDRGRLRDRRAVEPLGDLVEDESAPLEMRREAARILGQLSDRRAGGHLTRAMRADEPLVAAEAAIALGRMYDDSARSRLRELVHSEDPDLRVRAAVSLGRLRDREGVPALVEALWIAPSSYERQEAVRWLGRLRDERAVEPLLALIPEFRIRDLSVIALGTIGDRRAYEPLIEMLDWEHHTSIRDNVVRGLGQLGDPRAVPRLVAVAANEPDLENTSESLVRLGALHTGEIGGADVRPGLRGARGFGACHEGPVLHDWNYRHRTWCETQGRRVRVPLRVPRALRSTPDGAIAVLRVRRVDSSVAVDFTVTIADAAHDPVSIDSQWDEHRFTVPSEALATGRLAAVLEIADPSARLRLDHVLLVPRPAQVAAAPGTSDEVER